MGIVRFKKRAEGLHHHKFSEDCANSVNRGHQFAHTVEQNEEGHTKEQQEHAKAAQKSHRIIGAPTVENFKCLIKSNQVMNCPVTVDDIDTAQNTHGKDASCVKGRTTRRDPPKTLTPTMAMQ